LKALVIDKHGQAIEAQVRQVSPADLPEGDVTIEVNYSSINYKDAMVVRGLGGMVRQYPHIPGIDLAGKVVESRSEQFRPGDPVILTGHRVGESRWGGYAQLARVQSDWLIPLPKGFTLKRAMALGTAGLTAMLSVMALESHGIRTDGLPVLVTGATGGVGTLSIMILHALGYSVLASTGKTDRYDDLRQLGANEIIARDSLACPPTKALDKQSWSGCIDSVGGATLSHVLSKTASRGAVVAVGLAGGAELKTSLTPFLLRGVNLLGVASASCPTEVRLTAWNRLAETVPFDQLDQITRTISLEELPTVADEMLAGRSWGRTVVDVNA